MGLREECHLSAAHVSQGVALASFSGDVSLKGMQEGAKAIF